MEFVNDPIKSKRVFILMLILSIIFFIASVGLGYLYYAKHLDYQNLLTEKQALEEKLANSQNDLQKQVDKLTEENQDLEKANAKLTKENTAFAKAQSTQTKKNKITKAYIDFLNYLAQVTGSHNGFEGWTEAEYQHAHQIALRTKDNDFVETVEWAWNEETADPIDRLVRVLEEVYQGINDNI